VKFAAGLLLVFLAACSSTPERKGAYYKDDGPGDKLPSNLDRIADAVPRNEPLHKFANRPYQALGRSYAPLTSVQAFRQRGVASWYGKRYHGNKTSSGEIYDMYAMTAAHPTLPIPSYARITHAGNGRSVVVRINDRGPFAGSRIIDLSYVAAHKLGFVQAGSAEVTVESIVR
jgi:rare lipoprotein A